MATKAVNKFFRSGNLLALRQLALRQVALRIDQQIARYIRTHTEEGWQPAENVLVGISASPYAEQLVRAAYRLAVELNSDLTALHIETDQNSSEEEKKWIKNAFDLAEKLKIKKVAIPGTDYATSLSKYAQDHKITKIVIGKPSQRSSIRSVDSILSQTREIDVYIFAGGEEAQETRRLQTSDPLKEMIKKIKMINRVIRIR